METVVSDAKSTNSEVCIENQQQPEYLGDGSYTSHMLSSWMSISTRLLARGHTQSVIDYIFHTIICPKGHEKHMTKSAASEKFFNGVTYITSQNRVLKCLADFTQQLFVGQKVKQYREEWEAERRPQPKGTRPRLSLDEKAERLAEKRLITGFRETNNLGSRGKLKDKEKEEFQAFKEKYGENYLKKAKYDLEQCVKTN